MFPRPTGPALGKPPVPLFEHQALLIQGATVANISANVGRPSLRHLNLTANQLGARLNLPGSWILDNANATFCDDHIPYFSLGKFKRFRWNSPELNAWIERRVVCPGAIGADQYPIADYEYLDSAQFALRLNISESWVRDQVRTRATEVIPHARFGKYVRFRIGSPELEFWAEQRMVAGNNRVVSRTQRKETVQ